VNTLLERDLQELLALGYLEGVGELSQRLVQLVEYELELLLLGPQG
jgi:hypothetical protein